MELVLESPESAETSANETGETESIPEAAGDEVLVSDIPETLSQLAWFQVKVAP